MNINREASLRLQEQLEEAEVVAGVGEQSPSVVATKHHVVGLADEHGSGGTRHSHLIDDPGCEGASEQHVAIFARKTPSLRGV
ncbi:MAG: hypothetical protein AAF997_24335, partial [Myxococcota bacterium]